MVDKYYSPSWLADFIADWMPSRIRGPILDPSVGKGSLLAGVERRFKKRVSLYGIDIDAKHVQSLKKDFPHWGLSAANILSPSSRRSSNVWRMARGDQLAGVVINPPFSYRGGGGIACSYLDFNGILSPAAAFVSIILSELQPRYGVWGVLPQGVLDGKRCEDFWSEVSRTHIVTVEQELPATAFTGARARTYIVSMIPRVVAVSKYESELIGRDTEVAKYDRCRCIEIIRGRVARHTDWPVDQCDTQFLHTSDLPNRMSLVQTFAPSRLATIGESVLIPRVGNPIPLKVGYHTGHPVVLSDCLYALRPLDTTSIRDLYDAVVRSSSDLANEYVGTGARHLTVGSLSRFLKSVGYFPNQVKASSNPGTCSCGYATRGVA